MSCNSCLKVEPIDPLKHGLQYNVAEGAVSLAVPAIPPMRRPRGGWAVEIYIHGQKSTVAGINARDVAYNVGQLLELNEVLYTLPQLWLNLNIQWVERAVEKYQKVSLDELLNIAIPNY